MTIRFDGKVAIVTGAGNGLGKCHAIELAKRGAKVVVNDLGGARDGSGASSEAAQAVVKEIEAAGGEAMANGADVTKPDQVDAMVKAAVEKWGGVHILVNNAGILRDKSFAKVTLDDFRLVVEVHLFGALNCTKAVWPVMREQSYGRIVMTASSSGLYGNFGQSNYGTAKMGLVGMMNTLRLEGQKYNIRTNALAPAATTRMTDDILPDQVKELMGPELVTPGVLFLVSEDAPNGEILCAGGGGFARTRIYETEGVHLGKEATPELVAEKWEQISDNAGQHELDNGGGQVQKFIRKGME